MNTNLHHLKPPLLHPHLFFSPVNPYQFRHYKRRRLKPCKSSSNFLEPFKNFLVQFPPPNTLEILAPAFGLASGITLFLSQSNKFSKSSNIGEWVLFSSPTPFNRFVILRCPSISFEGSEFIENVNDKLVEGDRHFVTLNSGKIGVGRESGEGLKLEFQRVCVNTEDGGVISLDWPADLELEEEHGLETTLLLVPGTAKGSSEDNVRFLVVDALKRGFFPVVMNPRGCAASPITTARLFTAADSDDISTAIQFISKARPWTTLMGVGWGYGANMLTKYLAEVGECTPLTAATCINNPFDLEEATRCSPYHVALDQKLTGGLIDILQSNKEIFQGRAKGFDVENALVSKSVRDFDKAISMVSYGFEEIEDFYSKSSTRGMVGNVKIPVLFIQSDDGTVPLFSIPRSLIAENPFTSLLLCSSVPSSAVKSGRAAVSWCQNLTIEWLTAVELGLLKGRHPLLKDVDVNFNPSKGLPPVESRVSDKRVQLNKQSSLTPTDSSGYTLEPINKILQDIQSRSRKDSQRDLKLDEELQGVGNGVVQQRTSVDAELIEQDSADPVDIESGYTPEAINKILQDIQSRSRKDSQRDLKLDEELQGDENGVVQQRTSVDAELIEQDSADPVNIESGYTPEAINKILQDIQSRSRKDSQRELKLDEELQGDENGVVQQRTSVDAELIEQDSVDPVDIESGQAQQTAQVVMNMLDVMMPGTLTKEKKKVLTAVGQGETIMKALQDAVPEEVLGKLTTSVTGILQAQQRNLKVDGLLSSGEVPNIPITKIQEKVREVSSEEVTSKDPHSPDQMERAEDLTDGSVNNQPETEKSGAASEKELHSSKNIQKSIETIQSQVMSSQQGDPSGFDRKVPNESGHKNEKDEQGEKGLETSSIPNITSHSEKAGSTEETIIDESKVEQGGGTPLVEAKRENKNEEKTADSSADQNGVVSANMTEEPLPPAVSATDSQTIERDGNGDQKNEDKSADSSADQKRIVSANITEEPRPPEVSASDSETIETDGNGDQKRENKTMQPANDQNKPPTSDSNPPTFSVTEALDALTGMDDSTQVAVNSVFGVLENMISQFEEETDHEKIKNKNEAEGELVDSKPKKLENANDSGKLSDTLHHPPVHKLHQSGGNQQNAASSGLVEEEPTADPILYSGNGTRGSQGDTASNYEIKEEPKNDQLVSGKYLAGYDRHVNSIPLYVTANPYGDFLQNKYFHRYLLSKIPNSKPLDLDTTTALLLDYFPEEGKWKLLEHPGITGESVGGVITTSNDAGIKIQVYSSGKENDGENYIEPSYVVLDTEKLQEPVEEYSTVENITENGDDILDELIEFVKIVVLDDLRIEAGRKLGAASKKEMKSYLARDLELVADAVSLAVGRNKDHTWCLKGKYHRIEGTEEKVGTVQGEQIVKAISSAVLRTNNLRRLLPVGVIIGSSLAALRKYFNVVTRNKNDIKSSGQTQNHGQKSQDKACIKEMDHKLTIKTAHTTSLNSSINRDGEEATLKTTNNDRVMVGAVTAAFGASALLVQQQDPSNSKEGGESSPKFLKERGNLLKEAEKLEVTESEKNQNIVTSLAEKAMSVAGPVVPTKEDGGVDQERLVAMLANLGQQGGMLKLVGKIALLWGGIRGAMSLTDKLILFLHIAERPLYQRVLGFAGMVLVLWSPIFVPLLPTLVMSWTTSNPSRFAEFVCIVGLYTAIMILVTLWGRRIRGYEDPLEQYGLDLTALPKIQNFLWGLIGGVLLVGSIQSLNALLGCVTFSWPSSIPSSSLDAMTWLKMYVQMIMLAGRGIITASGIVLVEELLFRSWLPEEIKADVGYHQAIIISGLAFSLFQRSVWAIPGLWLFSLALAGFRQRSEGSLSIPIGLRTGIMASSFVLQTGGVLTYKSSYPVWVTGTPQLQPFSGAIGLAFSLLLAVMLYPRQPPLEEKSLARSSDEQ